MRRAVIVFLVFLLGSCSDQDKADADNTIAIDVGGATNSPFDDLFQAVDYVPLETNKNCFIQSVGKIQVYEDFIIVSDPNQQLLFLFDGHGKFITRIARQGDGPGEYRDLTDFSFDPKTNRIYILDGRRQSMLVYTVQNRFVRYYTIDPFHLSGAKFRKVGHGFIFDRTCYDLDGKSLSLYDSSVSFNKSAIGIPKIIRNVGRSSRSNYSDLLDGDMYYHPAIIDTIFKVSNDLEYTPEFYIHIVSHDVPPEIREAQHRLTAPDQFDAMIPTDKYVWDFNDLLMTDDLVYMGLIYKSVQHYVFYSRASGKTRMVYSVKPDEATSSYFSPIRTKYENKLVGIIDNPEILLKLQKNAVDVGEDSNPVLAFYTLREDF